MNRSSFVVIGVACLLCLSGCFDSKNKSIKTGCMGRAGSANGDIAAVQQALRQRGLQIVVDGKMGAETIIMLKRYQELEGLPITGKPDKATLASLNINSGEDKCASM